MTAVALLLGCNQIIGLGPPELLPTGTGGAVSTSSLSSSSSSTSSDERTSAETSSANATSGAGGAPPFALEASHLQLWLTAGKTVNCIAGSPAHVIEWLDSSNRGRDAAQTTAIGPTCGVHTLNGIDVPYFDAPMTGSNTVLEGTMDVDLSFLADKSYTIFVVERRTADLPANTPNGVGAILGTKPSGSLSPCGSMPPPGAPEALSIGYRYSGATPEFGLDFVCAQCQFAAGAATPASDKAVLDMVRFSPTLGTEIWTNGVLRQSCPDKTPLKGAAGGSLGRADISSSADTRFRGDIAEVMIFDRALTSPEISAMQGYFSDHWKQTFQDP